MFGGQLKDLTKSYKNSNEKMRVEVNKSFMEENGIEPREYDVKEFDTIALSDEVEIGKFMKIHENS